MQKIEFKYKQMINKTKNVYKTAIEFLLCWSAIPGYGA